MAVGIGQRCVVRIKITGVELHNAKDIVATVVSPQGENDCQEVSFDEVSGLVYVAVDVNSAGSYSMWLKVCFAEEVVYTPAFVFAEVEGEATPCDAPYIVDVEVAGESVTVTPPKVDVDVVSREEFEQLSEDVAGKVDKVEGKGLSTNDFTDEYKKKIDEFSGGGGGGGSITIDKELSDTSDNAIANSAVVKGLAGLAEGVMSALETKSNTEGYYPNMSVGMADNLVGRGDVQDAYINFRPSAGEANITDHAARIERIKGNSVVYNQLRKDNIVGNAYSFNVAGQERVYTFSDAVNTYAKIVIGDEAILKHKYLLRCNVVANDYSLAVITSNTTSMQGDALKLPTSGWAEAIVTKNINATNNAWHFQIYDNDYTTKSATLEDLTIIDLTKMFGAGNEPTTVEEYYQRKPMNIDDEFAYNEGELIDMKVNRLISTSDNAYNPLTYKARVMGGYKYDITANEGASLVVTFYADSEDPNEEREIAPDSEGKYIFPANGTCYVNGYPDPVSDICVCLNHSYDKPHPPYQQVVKDLSFIGEAFPQGMRSAGSVFDEIRFNPTKEVWEKVVRVGVRAYAEGDAEDSSVMTDGTTTNYPLDNPTPTTIDLSPNFNLDYFAWDFGTEEAKASIYDGGNIGEDSFPSAPFRADINYEPNAVDDLRWAVSEIRSLRAELAQLQSAQASETNLIE